MLPSLCAQSVENGFYGIGLLAQAGNLEGVVELQSIIPLLDALLSLPGLIKTQNISNSFYGIGLLAQAGNVQGELKLQSIIPLLEKLLSLLDLDAPGRWY